MNYRLLKRIAKEQDKNNKPTNEDGSETKGDYYYNTRQIVEKNKRLFSEGKADKCRYFEFKGYRIFDPFKDEKGEKEVDPKDYYGKSYEESAFNRVN